LSRPYRFIGGPLDGVPLDIVAYDQLGARLKYRSSSGDPMYPGAGRRRLSEGDGGVYVRDEGRYVFRNPDPNEGVRSP
jgi:hypothetical protein